MARMKKIRNTKKKFVEMPIEEIHIGNENK